VKPKDAVGNQPDYHKFSNKHLMTFLGASILKAKVHVAILALPGQEESALTKVSMIKCMPSSMPILIFKAKVVSSQPQITLLPEAHITITG
jgi:hypothetical protein